MKRLIEATDLDGNLAMFDPQEVMKIELQYENDDKDLGVSWTHIQFKSTSGYSWISVKESVQEIGSRVRTES